MSASPPTCPWLVRHAGRPQPRQPPPSPRPSGDRHVTRPLGPGTVRALAARFTFPPSRLASLRLEVAERALRHGEDAGPSSDRNPPGETGIGDQRGPMVRRCTTLLLVVLAVILPLQLSGALQSKTAGCCCCCADVERADADCCCASGGQGESGRGAGCPCQREDPPRPTTPPVIPRNPISPPAVATIAAVQTARFRDLLPTGVVRPQPVPRARAGPLHLLHCVFLN